MTSININLPNELKRVEREARRILAAKAKGVKLPKVKKSKSGMKYARRLSRYKEMTGKKRLSSVEKTALHLFTPMQVARRVSVTSQKYARRVKAYKARYGEPNEAALYALQFAGPVTAARRVGVEEKPKKDQKASGEWAVFTPVALPGVSWVRLPSAFTNGWGHESGTYQYNNSRILWLDNAAAPINLQLLFENGQSGYDHTNADFFRDFLGTIFRGKYLYDPNNDGSHFIVLASEWLNVAELAPDYATSRKYKKKE